MSKCTSKRIRHIVVALILAFSMTVVFSGSALARVDKTGRFPSIEITTGGKTFSCSVTRSGLSAIARSTFTSTSGLSAHASVKYTFPAAMGGFFYTDKLAQDASTSVTAVATAPSYATVLAVYGGHDVSYDGYSFGHQETMA